MECVVNPPQEGEPSYESFMKEKEGILSSLAERAKMVAETFNSVSGMTCNTVQGAMYAFPQVFVHCFIVSLCISIRLNINLL